MAKPTTRINGGGHGGSRSGGRGGGRGGRSPGGRGGSPGGRGGSPGGRGRGRGGRSPIRDRSPGGRGRGGGAGGGDGAFNNHNKNNSNNSHNQNYKKRKANRQESPPTLAPPLRPSSNPSLLLRGGGPSSSSSSMAKSCTNNNNHETLACVASPWGPIHTPVVSPVVQDILLERFQKELIQRYPSWLLLHAKQQRRQERLRQHQANNQNMKETKNNTPTKNIHHVHTEPSLLCHQDKLEQQLNDEERLIRSILQRRIIFGTNQCTRALEAAVASTCSSLIQTPQLSPSSNDISSMSPPVTTTTSLQSSSSPSSSPPACILMARDIYPPTMLAHIPVMARQVGTPIILLPRNASKEMGQLLLHTKRVAIVAFLPKPQEIPVATRVASPAAAATATTVAAPESALIDDANQVVANQDDDGDDDDNNGDKASSLVHAALDSFIEFVRSKATAGDM